MKYKTTLFGIFFALLLLSSCKITSALPDASQKIEIQKDDVIAFQVEGPPQSSMLKYEWYVIDESDSYPISIKIGEGKKVVFNFGVYASQISRINKFGIICKLYRYSYSSYCMPEPGTSCYSGWDWMTDDSVKWTLTRLDQEQNPPVWEGNFIISNDADQKELEGFTVITGNLNISRSTVTNLDSLKSIRTIGGHLTIQNNASLTSLGLDSLAMIGKTYNKQEFSSYAVDISNNPLLCTSLAEDLIDSVFSRDGITGEIDIFNNKFCN